MSKSVERGETYPEEETQRRRDEALRKALRTPPKPHDPTGRKKASPKPRPPSSSSAKPKSA